MHFTMLYLFIVIKLLVGFIIILFYASVSGKKRMGRTMTPITFIGNLLLGANLSSCFDEKGSFLAYILHFAVILLVISVTEYLSKKLPYFREKTVGHPITIIKDHRLVMKNINNKAYKLDLVAISDHLKTKGYAFVEEAYYARMEIDSTLTVVDNKKDIPGFVIIVKGVIRELELKEVERSKTWLIKILKEKKIRLNSVTLAEYNGQRLVITLNDGKTLDIKNI